MDATALNRSKRISPEGRLRWPSTETLAKILSVAGMDLRALAELMDALPENASDQRGT